MLKTFPQLKWNATLTIEEKQLIEKKTRSYFSLYNKGFTFIITTCVGMVNLDFVHSHNFKICLHITTKIE